MRNHKVIATVFVGALFALPIVACGPKTDTTTTQPFGFTADAGAYGTTAAPGNTMASPYGTAPTATATATAPAATAPAATAGLVDAAAVQLMTTQLAALAKKQAPGMKQEGQVLAGMLQEGQTIEQQATMYPGRCYTLVALGMPGIVELDSQIALTTPLPNLTPVIAVDNMTGTEATVAGKPNCYKPLMPIATVVKISIKATKGAGFAGAQLYAK